MQSTEQSLAERHASIGDGFSFGEFIELLRHSWVAALVCSIIGGGVAVALAWKLPPYYRATVLIVPASSDGSAAGALSHLAGQIAPLANLMQGGAAAGMDGKEAWVATLRSRQLAEQFINQHDLAPALFPKLWDASTGQWRQKGGNSLKPTSENAYRLFAEDVLSISEDRRTGLITVVIEARDPVMAADWANGLVGDVNEFIRQRAITESKDSLKYLEKEIASTNVTELQKVLYSMVESRVAKAMMANVRKEYAFSVVDPAVPSDPGNFVRPRRVVYLSIGVLAGVMAGFLFGFFRWARRQARVQTV